MSFLSPLLLGGLVLASVPIIIHLLNRRRFRVVVWAAMRFLLNAQKQNTRRMRLEQIILLAVRACVILLVVLAMAAITPWAEAFWNMLWPDANSPLRRQTARTPWDAHSADRFRHSASMAAQAGLIPPTSGVPWRAGSGVCIRTTPDFCSTMRRTAARAVRKWLLV